jgi:hypothetical protein
VSQVYTFWITSHIVSSAGFGYFVVMSCIEVWVCHNVIKTEVRQVCTRIALHSKSFFIIWYDLVQDYEAVGNMQFAFIVEFQLPSHGCHSALIYWNDNTPQHTYLYYSCLFALLLKPLSLFDMIKYRTMMQLGICDSRSLWSLSYCCIDTISHSFFESMNATTYVIALLMGLCIALETFFVIWYA